MHISIRSQLIAGTAAVVGASAIAMTPVTQAHIALPALHMPSAAQVALAGFDSPLSELIGTFNSFNQWMFSADDSTAGYLALGGLTDATGVGVAKTVLNFNSIGLLPQVINDHMPIVTQFALNGVETLDSTLNALTTMGLIGSEAVWNLPGAFVTAAQQAVNGDISAAVATLQAAIVTPFVEAAQVAADNVNFLVSTGLARSNALFQAIPDMVDLVVKASIGQASTMADAFVTVAQNVVAGISAGSAEQVWNAAVDGFFGPNGIPGTFLNLTVGAGVQASASEITPSIRGEIQAIVHGVATALGTAGPNPPVPPPSAAAKTPAASSLRAAAVKEEAPAADLTSDSASNEKAGDDSGSQAGGGSKAGTAKSSSAKSGAAKSSAKHGVAGAKRPAKASSGK